jgi:hypothetical protein
LSEESKGQQIRKNIRLAIEHSLAKYCPNTIPKMANLIAYDFNLSPDTLRYNYLPMFIDAGILELNQDNLFDLSAKGKHSQPIEDGLTEEEVNHEIEEENEKRAELGQHKVSCEEWKAIRARRLKPLQP